MSTETTAVEEVVKAPAEPLFSKKNKRLLSDPMNDSNPITVQVLGICSALAITVKFENAFIMSLSVLFVLICGNLTISAMRNFVPGRIRIIVQLVIVASLVIVVDQVLKAYVYDVSKQLSVFVGLIITNCIIMGRLEAFALANKPWPSALDAIGNGMGYAWILLVVAIFREVLGSGTLTLPGGNVLTLVPSSWLMTEGGMYMHNNMMILPPMALVIVGIIIWVQRARNTKLIEAE